MKNQFEITQAMREQGRMLFDLWSTLEGNAFSFDPLTNGDHVVTATKALERQSAKGNDMKEIEWTDVETGQSAITYTLKQRFAEFAKMEPVKEGDTFLIEHKKNGGFSNVKIKRKLPPQIPTIPNHADTYRSIFMYDIEVFMRYNLFVAKDILTGDTIVIEETDELRQFYLKNRDSLFVGYNNVSYDAKVTRAWLQGKSTFAISQAIVKGKNNSDAIYKMFDSRKTPFFQLDLYQDNRGFSLKEHEAFFGIDIRESEVDFESPEPLTEKQKAETIQYCKHDVLATEMRFFQNIGMLLAKVVICAKFGLSKMDVGLTNAALTAKILGAVRQKHDDLFQEFELPENLEIENQEVLEMFVGRVFEKDDKGKPVINLTVEEQEDLEHVFGSGGLHAALKSFIHIGKKVHRDANSLYPNIMILFMLLSRNIPEDLLDRYSDLLTERLTAKHSKEKTYTINGVTIPLKVLINGIKLPLNTKYGAEGAEFNPLYDPRNRLWVCIVGQLAMWDLFEKIKPHVTVIQSNTDAHDYIVNEDTDEEALEAIFKDWEQRTGLKLDGEEYHALYQKDVNNYLRLSKDGEVEIKGAIGLTHGLKISKAILSNAFINYVLGGHDFREYILNNNDLRQYQIITKTGYTFDKTVVRYPDGREEPAQKVNRVFAVKDPSKSVEIFKVKVAPEDDFIDTLLDIEDEELPHTEETTIVNGDSYTTGLNQAPEYYAISNEAVGEGIQIDEIDKEYYIDQTEKLLVLWFGENYEERLKEAHSEYKAKYGELPPVKEYITGN